MFCLHTFTDYAYASLDSVYASLQILFTQVYRFCLQRFTDSVYACLQIRFTHVYRLCLHRITDSVYTGLWVLFTQVYRFYFDTVPCQENIFIWFKCCELWMVKQTRCSTKV